MCFVEQSCVLKASLREAPCLAAGAYVSPSESACPKALLAHKKWRKSMRVWLTLCNRLMGYMQRLHSTSWHPDTSPCSCCGPQPSPILQAWPLGPFTACYSSLPGPKIWSLSRKVCSAGLLCWVLPNTPSLWLSGWLQVSPNPTVLCSPILGSPNSGQPPHQHHCKGLCESHGEGAENTSKSVSRFPQPHSTW